VSLPVLGSLSGEKGWHVVKRKGLGRKALAAVSCVAAFGSMAGTAGRADAATTKLKPKACGTCGGLPTYTWQDNADDKYMGVTGAGLGDQDKISVQAKDGAITDWAADDRGKKSNGWEVFSYINENSGLCLDDYDSEKSGNVEQFACSGFGTRRQFVYSQSSVSLSPDGRLLPVDTLRNVANDGLVCRARTDDNVDWFQPGVNRAGGSDSWNQCRWH
jgi:hypothetical protein